MAKPILVVRIPNGIIEVSGPYVLNKIGEQLQESCSDYNILTFIDSSVKRVEFETFNVQDYEQIDFETLRNKLENINKND